MILAEIRVFTSERCLLHEVPPGFPECPERLLRARLGLDGRWSLSEVESRPGGWAGKARELAGRTHDPAYIDRFERQVRAGASFLDTDDNPVSLGTVEATWAALEVCLATAEWVMGDSGRRGFALSRPPGHHAEFASAMGFCFFNHVAVVARTLLDEGLRRVAIVDFDVHHGNGTQHLFENSPQVLYVSLHQAPFYPGTGAVQERGEGPGVGATLNVALPAGTGGETLRGCFESKVVPEIERFAPEALLVSAGFDAWRRDPLGGMALEVRDFELLGQRLAALSERHCQGRMTSILEGGYDLESLGALIDAYLTGTSKVRDLRIPE